MMSWPGLIGIMAAAVLAGGGTPRAGTGDGEFSSSIDDHNTWLHVIEDGDHALISYAGTFGPGCASKPGAGWCRTCEMGFTRAEREGPQSYLVSNPSGRLRLRRADGAWRLERVEGSMDWCGVGWTGDVFGAGGGDLDTCTIVSTGARWYTVRNDDVVATDTGIERGSPVLAIASGVQSDHEYVMARAGRTVGLLKLADIRCDASGVGVWPPEEVRAVADHQRACDGGDAKGCDDLGKSYEAGRGVPEDRERALALYQKACDGGYAIGCDDVGRMYHLGIGVVVDDTRARALFTKACDGGVATGCRRVGEMFWRGTGVAKDDSRAVALYKQACDGGDAEGCDDLGLMYKLGRGVAEDDARALALHERACDGGYTADCTEVGEAYEEGDGVVKDVSRAAVLYRRACDGDDAKGCRALGWMYEQGSGVGKDEVRAAALYKQACDDGETAGCNNLGVLYEEGRGVPKDKARAASLYKQACDGGEAMGCTSLKRLGR
jgi:TPR repeat protein